MAEANVQQKALLTAEQTALVQDDTVTGLTLRSHRSAVAPLDLGSILVAGRLLVTMEGVSTLELDVEDSRWSIEASGLIDADEDGQLDLIDVVLDGVTFTLSGVRRRGGTTLTFVFDDQVAALLKLYDSVRSWSRGTTTRAGVIRQLCAEVKQVTAPYDSPLVDEKQDVASPNYPDAKPARGTTGFSDDSYRPKITKDEVDVTVVPGRIEPDQRGQLKAIRRTPGFTADAQQSREIATSLTVADQQGAAGRARLALLCAGFGESNWRAVVNKYGYGGVFGGDVSFRYHYFKRTDTAGQARYFLIGGKGYQQGGAIALAREHPDWVPGKIALEVLGSRSNFGSESEAVDHYQKYIGLARAIDSRWKTGPNASTTDDVVTVREYTFQRGTKDDPENSIEFAVRLADEVRWRFWVAGNVVSFQKDDYLIGRAPEYSLSGPLDSSLVDLPDYEFEHGKPAGSFEVTCSANRWGVRPGEVMRLADMGPLTGDWIVLSAEYDLFSPEGTVVTLTKPMAARKEPAPEILTRTQQDGKDTTDLGAGVQDTLKWARSKIGHYKEEFGPNRGDELNALEKRFGLEGAPWCAMFATTAVVQGGVTRDVRTASVADIQKWAAAGTHGFQKGSRSTPQPGDLFCTGTTHTGLVETVNRAKRTVETIEGNTSAGEVSRGTRSWDAVNFVRPDYP